MLIRTNRKTLGILVLLAVGFYVLLSASGYRLSYPTAQFVFVPPFVTCPDGSLHPFGYACPTTSLVTTTSSANTMPIAPVTIDVWQDWQLFDIHGNQYGALTSQKVLFPLGFSNPAFIATANAGFIRIAEHHVVENTVPGFDSGLGFFLYSGVISGQLLVNGQPFSQLQQSPFPAPGYFGYAAIQNYLPNAVNAGVAFSTGDLGGTSRDSVFYLIFNKALQPSACSQYPSSCIDMTNIVAQGQDVSLSATFQETWIQWSIDFNPIKAWFGPCDYTVYVGIGYSYCIKNTGQLGPTPVTMPPAKLSSMGILTTMLNGSPTFIPTMTATTYGTNTIGFTTTVVSNQTQTLWSIKYSNTTTIGTVTNPGSSLSLPNSCDSLFGKNSTLSSICKNNLSLCGSVPWLCASTLGIPNWLIAISVILFAIYLIFRRPSGAGSSVTVVTT